jgi:hypothetical protein
MTEPINTQKRSVQYRGPVSSSDYNSRIEENYRDLLHLYNKTDIIDSKLSQSFERVIKDQLFLGNIIKDLSDRIKALESQGNKISIHSFSQLDYVNLIGTSFSVSSNDLLYLDPYYNTITLPRISGSSTSKLKFFNSSIGQIVPDFFKTNIENNFAGVDSAQSVINTTPTYNSILDDPNKVWKRNIISSEALPAGAQMMFYVKIPVEFTGSTKANCIKFNPYPMYSVDIASVEYTTTENPTLTQSDLWIPLNSNGLYNNVSDAIGAVAPGGWSIVGSDSIYNSGPLAFYFAEKNITAIRIKMNQKNYFKELDKYIYSYGLSDLDIRYDKFLPTGKTIIKFSAPQGQIIEEITDVEPMIYNVPLSRVSEAFSYRVIYEDAGTYTLNNPGASNDVWIEVTLNMTEDKTPPVLSDLVISYN